MACPCQSKAKTDQQTSAQTAQVAPTSPETLNHPQRTDRPQSVTASASR